MRYNDIRNGTETAELVLKRYSKEWSDQQSMMQGDGLLINWYLVKQKIKVPAEDAGLTAWFV